MEWLRSLLRAGGQSGKDQHQAVSRKRPPNVARLRARGDVEGLVAALDPTFDPNVAAAAAEALADIEAHSALGPLRERLAGLRASENGYRELVNDRHLTAASRRHFEEGLQATKDACKAVAAAVRALELDDPTTLLNAGLLLAAEKGDAREAARLLSEGADPNAEKEGHTALALAAWGGHTEALVALLDAGADVERSGRWHTPLWAAVCRNHADAVDLLLSRGAAVESTMLHRAVDADSDPTPRVYAALIVAGADVHARDRDGRTPLMHAAWALHGGSQDHEKALAAVRALLKHGAQVSDRCGDAQTPLHYAASGGSARVAEELLSRGADVNARDRGGTTPLYLAAGRSSMMVRILIDAGADVNAIDDKGCTPLHSAATGNKRSAAGEVVGLLAEKGAYVNALDNDGWTPLHHAAAAGKWDAVGELLRRGAHPGILTPVGSTARELAALHGHRSTAAILAEAEAAPS